MKEKKKDHLECDNCRYADTCYGQECFKQNIRESAAIRDRGSRIGECGR